MHRFAIAAGALALAFAASPADAGIRRNGLELNGIRWNGIERNGINRNGLELNGIRRGEPRAREDAGAPRFEGLTLRDGTVLLPAER